MYLFWVLALLCISFVASEHHCIEPADCPFYPVQSCYATKEGMLCQNRHPGFELSIDPIYTFLYIPFTLENDTGLPCTSIPVSDELISYVEYRGPQVIEVDDLPLIGNCSHMSYCDQETKTCQPKRMYRSPCQHNMQCYYGIDGIPGHCTNHSICDARSDILYYNPPQQWKVGDDWRISIIAVLATGAIVIGVIVGRNQLAKLVKKVNAAIEKWQNPDTSVQPIPFENEEAWSRYHDSKWWKQMPGFKWVYSKLKRNDQGQYYQLNNRMDGVEEPPPYQQ